MEYDKKRIVIHKPNLKQCDVCKENISLYSFSSHIKWSHKMTSDEYAKMYGEFRKPKRLSTNRKVKKIICQLCNTEFSSVGLFTHLRDTHNISTDEYVSKFGEYRPSKLREIEYVNRLDTINDDEKQICVICNTEFASGMLLGGHIKKIHKISKKQYITKHVFNGIHPVCKCGCGRNVKILNYFPYKVDYISGHNYLKHTFHSYWKSKFKGNLSPENAWLDDKIMKDVIEYRIGCNDSEEVYDFSLHQLVRGLSARRVSVSFFKPILAASIYKKYIGDKTNPIVLDPCCGFGGRLLGFKSVYPNGTYIGCEPNIETYNELIQLVKNANWKNVIIHNIKFENFHWIPIQEVEGYCINNNFDLIFTSIPYFDVEIYSNNTEYKSFDEWKNVFIKSIELYKNKNCYINTTEELSKLLDWNNIDSYIISNRSHFDNKQGDKKEVIVKI